MKNIISVFLLFCAFAMNAQVMQVSGNQSGTWEGEVHIVGDVFVLDTAILTINAGTNVIADGYFMIAVDGELYANGEENARITFTVADTTGYSNYEDANAGAWHGFTFNKIHAVNMRYCDFSYGKTELNCDGGMMRVMYSNNFELANCRFHHNTTRRRGGALYAESSSLSIHDTEVYDNLAVECPPDYTWGVGFHFLKCDIEMHDMVFHNNNSMSAYGGGMNIDSCNMTLNNAVFYDNMATNAGGLGIQRCMDYTVKVSNMLAYNNTVIHYGGGLATAMSCPELNNLTIVDNICGGGGGAGMQTYAASPILNNCIFWGNREIYKGDGDDMKGNTAFGIGSQIWLWGDGNAPVFHNGIVEYGLDSINGYYQIPPENYVDMLDVDPLFVDSENHDYRLLDDSPCIDAGLADISGLFITDKDLAGGPRVFNGRIDIGCYEWNNLGVNEHNAETQTLSIYPNPLTDNALCIIKLNEQRDVQLRLISLDGKEVYREDCGTLKAGENRIPLDGMLKNLEKTNKIYLLIIDNRSVKIIY